MEPIEKAMVSFHAFWFYPVSAHGVKIKKDAELTVGRP